MSEIERVLDRAALRQAALIAVPWILLQLGIFWALASPLAGDWGVPAVGVVVSAAILALAVWYRRAEAELANLLLRQMDSELEYYGVFTWFRQWGEQLELVRRRCPGYLNTLRLNYISLPLALLAFLLQFWGAALLLLPVWLVTGMLVRAAMAGAVLERELPAFRPSGWKVLLLLALAYAAWAGVDALADRAKRSYGAELARIRQDGWPVSAEDLRAGCRLNGPNGAELAAALGEVPEIPNALADAASPVWVENVPADCYAGMEKYLFEHGAFMEKLAEIGRIPKAQLGYEFEKGFDGIGCTQEAIVRYRRLGGLVRLRLLAAAGIGNDRRVVESWTALGNLRRQLSGEPGVVYALVAMAMESRRIDALERVVNEFGIHSEEERNALLADLAATEREVRAQYGLALRGEAALALISGFRPAEGGGFVRGAGLSRWIPALRWAEFDAHWFYLKGMELYCSMAEGKFCPVKEVEACFLDLPPGAAPAAETLALIGASAERYVGLLRKIRAARIGLALDGYRLAHGGFPESLPVLEGLSARDLLDPETGAPMRYASGFRAGVTDLSTGKQRRQTMEGVEIGGEADGFRLRK